MAYPSDIVIDFVTWESSPFAWFRALCHFDLKVCGMDKIVSRHAESSGGNLFDSAVAVISILVKDVSIEILSTFTRVAFCPDPVHSYCEGFVSLSADGTKGYCSCGKSLNDVRCRFHFIKGYRIGGFFEVKQTTECR